MHSFVWGETYPDFMMLSCRWLVSRCRLADATHWRKMVMDAIETIRNGKEENSAEPQQGLRTAVDLLLIAGSAPLHAKLSDT